MTQDGHQQLGRARQGRGPRATQLGDDPRPRKARAVATLAQSAEGAHGSRAGDPQPEPAPADVGPRLVIDRLSPCVDQGCFAAKGVEGQGIEVAATVFADGHEQMAVRLLWKNEEEGDWRIESMRAQGNDRWQAVILPAAPGLYRYVVEAWVDTWGGYCAALGKKLAAGAVEVLDVEEGRALVTALADRVGPTVAARVHEHLQHLDQTAVQSADRAAELLLDDSLRGLMSTHDERRFLLRSAELSIDVERRAAGFSSWYELFPRSQAQQPGAHGSFDDVIGRLPAIQAMGFDVLYFPPIHPIGLRNRKGRNNALRAEPDDPGSPYAIGSAEGGHHAVHPQLGGIEGFRRLCDCARQYGLEIALDFAIQCSPDHPWLTQHPDWFQWRADGSMRYAENPPKKYEDIVNVAFYTGQDAQSALWEALRDVVQYWVDEGVRIFRVDNPHTKPLPFWSWLIADIRARDPGVIFLSEAFTRPAMMYRLAKIGFAQSYTYFTWRNTKAELTEYLHELTHEAPRDFYRPNFFVNTPDINPEYLHHSGRAGFLIRAALAATLSGLWGLYSGFELCESAPLPGKEEYLDSEKYQLRSRNWSAPGNIVAEITRLNHLRRAHPALQTHLGLRFHLVDNEQVLFFSKCTPDRSSLLFVAISLDPHGGQHALFTLPRRDFGLPESGPLRVEELIRGIELAWHEHAQHWYFDPGEIPFAIWRVQPPAGPR